MSDDTSKPSPSEDPELNELLDSALEDFSKPKTDKKVQENDASETSTLPTAVGEEMWSEEFIKQAAQQFESHMSGLLGNSGIDSINPDQIGNSFQRMAEAAALALQPDSSSNLPPVDQDFAATIAQTLQGLSSGADNLQSPFDAEALASMFSGLDMGEGPDAAGNAVLPFMQGIMQSLLSADVLLPSMKDLLDKFPQWLEEHKNDTPAADLDRYKKQQELMTVICNELEQEKETDTAEIKKQRFDKVLELMQKMQHFGQPPSELLGDAAGFPMDGQIPGMDPSQCSVM